MATTIARSNHPEFAPGVPMGLELGLRNYWYPVLQSEELGIDAPVGFKCLGEALVAWRDEAGAPHVLADRCPHRGAMLSAGRVLDGDLQCIWHGLRFDGDGRCTLIPWEAEDSRLKDEISAAAYPAQELGGYVWAYLGDPVRFPPPALEDAVPEELNKPDEFICFRLPGDVWQANWLQCLEGSDSYHAVILHSRSQAVANESWKGGRPREPDVPLAERRMKIVDSPQGPRGVAIDKDGNALHHGHFVGGWKGDRWTLPGVHSVPLQPVPDSSAYASRLFQFPIDETRTQVSRYVVWRASSEDERARHRKLWDEVVHPRQLSLGAEDRMIVETLGSLQETRSEEFLLPPDIDILRLREKIAGAYLAQLDGRAQRPTRDDLQFPV